MQNSDWKSTRLDGGCFFVVVGGAWCGGARHLFPFLYLAPNGRLVPGTKKHSPYPTKRKKSSHPSGLAAFCINHLFLTRPCLYELDERLVVGVDQADALDEPFDGEEQDREEDQASPDGGHGEDDGG